MNTQRRYGWLAAGLVAAAAIGTIGTPAVAAAAPSAQATISSVVAAEPSDAQLRAASPADQARALVRCTRISGLNYCLGYGWTDKSAAAVSAEVADLADKPTVAGAGDQSFAVQLAERAAQPLVSRQQQAKQEMADAYAAAGKVADLQSADLAAYPVSKAILDPSRVAEQERSYWCGPTSMQMIGWNWSAPKVAQSTWATRLGTTTSGSSISAMVNVTNSYTGWDNADYAGKYIVLDIGGYTAASFFTLIQKHTAEYRAPVILHPMLYKRYYSYLPYDGSGHFQVGRGYDRNTDKIHIFEPWNPKRFNPDVAFVGRLQSVDKDLVFAAHKAHAQHNLGV